jgi:hypothetical protein
VVVLLQLLALGQMKQTDFRRLMWRLHPALLLERMRNQLLEPGQVLQGLLQLSP